MLFGKIEPTHLYYLVASGLESIDDRAEEARERMRLAEFCLEHGLYSFAQRAVNTLSVSKCRSVLFMF